MTQFQSGADQNAGADPTVNAASVDNLVQAQVPEKIQTLCGDCKWSGDVVLTPRNDDPQHAEWICPRCHVVHVVKICSSAEDGTDNIVEVVNQNGDRLLEDGKSPWIGIDNL